MKFIKSTLKLTLIFSLFFYSTTSWLQDVSHLYFDGVNDFVETHNTDLDYMWDDFTVEAIIKGNEEEQGTDPTILSNRWSPIKGNTFYLKNVISGPRVLCFSHGGQQYWIPDNGGIGSLLDGECHHVAIVKDGDDMFFYSDGVLFGALYDPYYYCGHLEGYNPIWIGRDHESDNLFKGVIGKVRVWDIARNGEEIASNIYTSMDGTEAGLEGCWELNEGSGQHVLEKTDYGWSGFLGTNSFADGDGYDPDWFPGDYCAAISDYGHGDDDGWEEEEEEEDDDDGVEDGHTASIDDNNQIAISVYPNPVQNDILFIDLTEDVSAISVTITTTSGQIVLQDNFKSTGSRIGMNLSNLSKGVYFIQIEHNSGRLTEKFMKN